MESPTCVVFYSDNTTKHLKLSTASHEDSQVSEKTLEKESSDSTPHPQSPQHHNSLSFGVEVECLFVYSESALNQHLQTTAPGSRLVKDIPEAIAKKWRFNEDTESYNSWAIIPAGEHPSLQTRSYEHHGEKACAFHDEPLRLAQHILKSSDDCPDFAVHCPSDNPMAKQSSYSTWSLQNDSSLSGLSKQDLHLQVQSNKVLTSSDWDSWGIELVSPPYAITSLPAVTSQLRSILHPLKNDSSTHTAAVNAQCGLHVHIGHTDNSPFSLLAIKHLLYLLTIYEDVITSLHVAHRREIYSTDSGRRNFILSIRNHWMSDESLDFTPAANSTLRLERNAETGDPKTFITNYSDLSQIRHDIFSSTTLERLVNTVQTDRFHTVNLRGLVDPERPNTIEFRQHAGSLDADEMTKWTQFCASLVSAAKHFAEIGTQSPQDGVKDWEHVRNLQFRDLSQLLNLDPDLHDYFEQKISKLGYHVNPLVLDEDDRLPFPDIDDE